MLSPPTFPNGFYLLPAPCCCCFGCVAFAGGSGGANGREALAAAPAGCGCGCVELLGTAGGLYCQSRHEMRSNQVCSPLLIPSSRGFSSSSPSTHVALEL